MQEVVLERLAGIKREYEELDTVWFMAGSLFKVFPSPTSQCDMKPNCMFRLTELLCRGLLVESYFWFTDRGSLILWTAISLRLTNWGILIWHIQASLCGCAVLRCPSPGIFAKTRSLTYQGIVLDTIRTPHFCCITAYFKEFLECFYVPATLLFLASSTKALHISSVAPCLVDQTALQFLRQDGQCMLIAIVSLSCYETVSDILKFRILFFTLIASWSMHGTKVHVL